MLRPHSWAFLLAFSASLSNALVFPFSRSRQSSPILRRSGVTGFHPHILAASDNDGDGSVSIQNVHDLIYMTNITVGGNDYVVQIDTGSSDLWIKGSRFPLPNSHPTTISRNVSYGIGWANGTVSYAAVEFAGIKISQQAFLDVYNVDNPLISYDADGLVGLGFTSLSTIDALVNQTGASSGRSLLYNAFAQNPDEPNYITFALQRVSDPDDDVEGAFTIGETAPEYASIMNTPPIPTFPENSPTRWNVLLDGLIVNNKQVSVTSTVTGAPSNKAVVLLDTGTSYSYSSVEICNAIYGGVPGAHFESRIGQWIVPCEAEIDIALQIGGRLFPLHPLDVTPASISDPTRCFGTFIPQPVAVGVGDFDWLIGDNVLRSAYTLYDFGDFDSTGKMGNPYVKMLPLTDPVQASKEFHQVRGGEPNTNFTYNAAPGSGGGSTSTINISDDLAKTLNNIGTFFPALLAIMALNALVILLAIIAGGVYMWRRRTRPARRRVGLGRTLTPMPGQHSAGAYERTTSYDMGPVSGTHQYQPVSMALTEDTFVPPSPAFSKGDRPKSVA
ncbi:acid protease [Cristinia sonorae]|uniref:Acid protease n=1 Tax=Cristinia sonorae TaxID=1940300 RepID=A0A8K0XTZ6_9AGAR|nr:acid protease [Cristinia sonorae]